MKKHLIFIICFGMFVMACAQENTLATGGEATGSGGSVSFSVGQIAIHYTTGDSLSFSEGVQQPFEISLNGVDNYPAIELHAQVYPNPTQWNATLHISDINLIDKNLQARLYDGNGRLLSEVQVISENTLIELSTCAAGTYFLNVSNDKIQLKSFKIIKTR